MNMATRAAAKGIVPVLDSAEQGFQSAFEKLVRMVDAAERAREMLE